MTVVLIFIGLSGGIVVGSAFVALLTVLDIVPRLHQLTCTTRHVGWSEQALAVGAVFWTCADFFDWQWTIPAAGLVLVGLLAGCFVGMLAAALTEVLNVLPILSKRLAMERWLFYLLMAMVLGKVCGSLLQWLLVA